MDTVLLSIVKDLPGAGAIIITVILFIRFIKNVLDDQKSEREATKAWFKEIHSEHLDARQLTRLALEKHADITLQNIIATQKNTDTLERLSLSIERCGVRVDPNKPHQ